MAIVFDKPNRIIEIEAPATEVTIQELLYAIRGYENTIPGMDIAKIADASGKEDLGGGVLVGITLKLFNWKLKFSDRPGPTWIVCNVTGGNLVAVDGTGTFVNPIEPSSFVTVTKTSSASATIAELQIINLQYLIESLRGTHKATGNVYYWNPVGGDDAAAGTKPTTARKTFASAQGLCTDYNNDVIMGVAAADAVETLSTEKMTITVPNLRVRGTGNNFVIRPVGSSGSMCWIGVPNVEIESMVFDGIQMSASQYGHDHPYSTNAVGVVNADNVQLKNITGKNIPGTP